MAGWNLPETIDQDYADSSGDPSVLAHQQHHDRIHDIVNRFEKDATPTTGTGVIWDGALYQPIGVQGVSRYNPVSGAYEPARPSWYPFGWVFLSTNDANAPVPPTTNLRVGDRLVRHPSAPTL